MSAPLAQFTNGFEIIFNHISGYTIAAKSKPGIALNEGDLFKIQHEGMPNPPQNNGDLYLRFHNNDDDKPVYDNTISLVSAMPCEMRLKHVTAEKAHNIPEDEVGCAQQ